MWPVKVRPGNSVYAVVHEPYSFITHSLHHDRDSLAQHRYAKPRVFLKMLGGLTPEAAQPFPER